MLIELERDECERLLTILAKYVTWEVANPLIVKINKQMQQQPMPVVQKGNSDEREIPARPKAR